MNDELPQDRVIEDFKKDIQNIFGLPVSEWGYGYDFHTSAGSSNYAFRKSKYFLEDANKQMFFHLTTYKNFFAIMNSGTIRMYNLLNSKDDNELNTYNKDLKQDQIKRIKEYIFTFSCCKADDVNNKTLWENYGQVAIFFEFANDPLKWDFFHLSSVFYKDNEPAFEKYFEVKREYEKEFQNFLPQA